MTAAGLLLALAAAASSPPAFLAVVDPGHGGEREGASGPGGQKEKQLTLQIARRVAKRLEKAGGRVVMTRTRDEDVPLAQRAAMANARQADLFLSIHLNSMPGRARQGTAGIETYFLSADASDASAKAVAARENADRLAGEERDPEDPVAGILDSLGDAQALAESSRLAYAIHERLVGRVKADDRGVKQAPFYVLAGARMAAVLLEVGFISHPGEAKKLAQPAYQEELAAAVAEGVLDWRKGQQP
ncbi:MAG: N-acetylmuramoyl-L-alanine amidase [Deltaproteobacteria bacterium]|nr:N-acetylmuramoyl-L-alanine amidase [Deltaproteobacteria bacterium]